MWSVGGYRGLVGESHKPEKRLLNGSLLAWCMGCAFFALSVLLPFQEGSWPGFYQEMLATLGLVCWVLAVRPQRWHGFSLVAALLVSVVVGQYFFGVISYLSDAVLAVAYLFMLSLAFEVGAALRADETRKSSDVPRYTGYFEIFWWVLIGAASLSALIAFHQWLGNVSPVFEFPMVDSRPYGNLAQPNLLSTLLLMGVGGVLFLHQRRAFAGWAGSVIVCFLLVAVALTVARSAWVFALVGLSYLVWKVWRAELRLPKWAPWFFALFFLASIFGTEYISQQMALPQLSLSGRFQAAQMNRLNVWEGLLTTVMSGPWYGHGFLQASTAALSSSVRQFGEYFSFSHNLFIDLLVWMGPWLGLAVVIWLVAWVGRHFLQSKNRDEIAVWLALLALFVHSMVEFPYAYVFLLVPGGVMLGWVTGQSRQMSCGVDGRWAALLPVTCAAVLLLGSAMVFSEYHLLVKAGINDHLRQRHLLSFEKVDLSQVVLLDAPRDQQLVQRLPVNKMLSADQLRLLERVTSRFPSFSNSIRLEKDYVRREDAKGVCAVMNVVHKFYKDKAMDIVQKTAGDLVSLSQCKEMLKQSGDTGAAKKYPMVLVK